ncbi:MAG: ATP-binding cassette domain-containing protein, partial [Chloroflexota bacterium]|nr:ATP-binding cassette domain-containing protein [Chloroflexota bacterium]
MVELNNVCVALSAEPQNPALVERYDQALAALTRAQEMEGTRKEILSGFQLLSLPHDTPVDSLSGGQKVRLALAGVLLESPQALLLDEPTNHRPFRPDNLAFRSRGSDGGIVP